MDAKFCKLTLAVATLAGFVFISSASIRAETEPDFCAEFQEAFPAFHDFDKILIYYAEFPSPDRQGRDEYSPLLKYESLNQTIAQTIESNFAPCLKTQAGGKKSIVSVAPNNMVSAKDDKQAWGALFQGVMSPRHLVIAVSLTYEPYQTYKDDRELTGTISWLAYRAGSALYLPLHPKYYSVTPIYPKRADLEQQLDTFASSIRLPREPYIPDPSNRYQHGDPVRSDWLRKRKTRQ